MARRGVFSVTSCEERVFLSCERDVVCLLTSGRIIVECKLSSRFAFKKEEFVRVDEGRTGTVEEL